MTLSTARLADYLQKVDANLDAEEDGQLHYWFDTLAEYRLTGNESPEELTTIVDGFRHVMLVSFAGWEEVRALADKEAATWAEKEEAARDAEHQLRMELDQLREQLTATTRPSSDAAGAAFRAQIDALRDERRELEAASREQDSQLAETRERAERLAARAEQLAQARDLAIAEKENLEETVRELSARLAAASRPESGASAQESDAKRAKIRYEQALRLSQQLQTAVKDNEELRAEVERLQSAIEKGTLAMDDSAKQLIDLGAELAKAHASLAELTVENRTLAQSVDERQELAEKFAEQSALKGSELTTLLTQRDDEIADLKQQLGQTEEERARLAAELGIERADEQELEKLRQELVAATQTARRLFSAVSSDETSTSAGADSKTPDAVISALQLKLIRTERRVEEKMAELNERSDEIARLEEQIAQKDAASGEMSQQIYRLRKEVFGSADEEVARLELQLRFRDSQIAQLTRRVSLLHLELGQYVDPESVAPSKAAIPPPKPAREHPHEELKRVRFEDDGGKSPQHVIPADEKKVTNGEKMEPQAVPPHHHYPADLDAVEAQALIIASLNSEVMRLIQEREDREEVWRRQLEEVDKWQKQVVSLKSEISTAERALREKREDLDEMERAKVLAENTHAEERIELEELRRLAENIRQSGAEAERRFEETTRKILAERVGRFRLERRVDSLQRALHDAEEDRKRLTNLAHRRMREHTNETMHLRTLLDSTTLELARTQSQLLSSVPVSDFENLKRRLVKGVQEQLGIEDATISAWIPSTFELTPKEEMSTKEVEQLRLQNDHLQRLVDALSDETSHLAAEQERTEAETNELRAFLLDIEQETELKHLIGGMERRLLAWLRKHGVAAAEAREAERKAQRATRSAQRAKHAWNRERTHLLRILQQLQLELSRSKESPALSLTFAQLQRMQEQLKQLALQQAQVEETLNKAEESRTAADRLHSEVASMDKARKELERLAKEQGLDYGAVERHLGSVHAQLAAAIRRAHDAHLETNRTKEEIVSIRRESEELRAFNTELLTDRFRLDEALKEDEHDDMGTKEKTTEGNDRKNEQEQEDDDDNLSLTSSGSGSSSFERQNQRISVPETTVIVVNDEHLHVDCERRLELAKQAAQLCVQSYQEQLDQRDRALERYRKQLTEVTGTRADVRVEEKESQKDQVTIIDIVQPPEDPRLKDLETELHELEKSNRRLKTMCNELEEANRKLARQTISQDVRKSSRRGDSKDTQTDDIPLVSTANNKGQETDDGYESKETTGASSDRDDLQKKLTAAKMETRKVRERLAQANKSNRQLAAACEQLKNEAVNAVKMAPDSSAEIISLRAQLDRALLDRRKMNAAVSTLRAELEEMKRSGKNQPSNTSDSDERARQLASVWERAGRAEQALKSTKQYLKEKLTEMDELKRKLELREKHITDLARADAIARSRVGGRRKGVEASRRLDDEKMQTMSMEMEECRAKNASLSAELLYARRQLEAVRKAHSGCAARLELATQRPKEVIVEEAARPNVDNKAVQTMKVETSREQQQQQQQQLVAALSSEISKLKEQLDSKSRLAAASPVASTAYSTTTMIYDSAAVAVLRDKLVAKDRYIAQLKERLRKIEDEQDEMMTLRSGTLK